MLARTLIVLAAVGIAFASAQTPSPQAPDHCAQYSTCDQCVGHFLCGWCSTPVIYQNNVTGTQCAGYNPTGPDPFECTGIYSIEECTIGYECDLDTYQCVQAGPGKGNTLQKCEANCTNLGQVYLCNHTTLKCYEVPRGTPGASSYSVCEASCAHPSPHPAPPVSPAPPAAVFACNTTTGQCVPAPAGKGSSMAVCEEECKKVNPNSTQYFCNTISHTCEIAPSGFPGETKAECEAVCLPHPNPGPPSIFLGTWRGIQIQNGYKIGEFDLHVDQTSVTLIDILAASTIKGTPFNVQNGNDLNLWIKVTAGPGAGQTIKVIGEQNGRGPETKFLTAAFSAPGGATPDSIVDAMKASSGDQVYFFSACVGTPECHFSMPASLVKRTKLVEKLRNREHRRNHRGGHVKVDADEVEANIVVRADGTITDACEQWSANCSYCLQHPFCGWCSEDVIYQNGQKGSQCAGFAHTPNETNPFVCEGRYSTDSCTQGWECNTQTYQCTQTAQPGNGYPKTECEEICRPTPSPTPQQNMYVCNLTNHQCYKCEEAHCPGAMPEATCEAACVKPHKGPTSLVKGVWRGIQIQRGYPLEEVEYVFNASSLTVFRNGNEEYTADVTSFGGDEMIFKVVSGINVGVTFSAEYTVANQGTGQYEVMTIAMSGPNGAVPDSYAGPMQTPGEKELVMAKCNSSPCQFNPPS